MSTKKGPDANQEQQPEGENDWFFDIIINFLRSPRWKTPIMSFLDEYCIIFDSEDENKLEYTPIHSQFKKLVEELIGELLAELGVDQDVFMGACAKAEKNPIHKKIVDQIVAVDNFVAFKRLMCKRNAELNQQAMKLIEKEAGKKKEEEKKTEEKKENSKKLIEESTKIQQDGAGIKDKGMQEALKIAQEMERAEEEEFMKKALEESSKLEEIEKKKHEVEADEEMKMIEQAIAMSQKEEEVRVATEQKKVQEEIKSVEKVEEPIPAFKQPEPIVEVKAAAPPKRAPVPTPAPVEEVKIEEPVAKIQPPVITPSAPVTKELVTVIASGMSDAEKQKLEQLKAMKKANKLKKQNTTKVEDDLGLPKLNAGALPPVMMNRRGQFDMVPDFLQQKKEVFRDQMTLQENDMMGDAMKKQDKDNEAQMSMSELMAHKRKEAEKKLEEAKANQSTGPSKSDVNDRKARLLAQRDLLRKQKEQKRQDELQTFKQKTETKEDLFSELKKMDDGLKAGGGPTAKKNNDEEAERRLSMFRKVRQDMKEENKVENEQNYQKRITDMEEKDKKKKTEVNMEDGDDWLSGIKTAKPDAF